MVVKREVKSNYMFKKKDLFALIIPLIIEQLLAVAVGMADTIMVSSVGESAVSAVSLVDSINILLINVFAALATGGAVIAGQYIGKNKPEKASEAAEQLVVFVTLISLIITAVMYLGRNFILTVVFGSIEPDVASYAYTYMNIVFISIPFIAVYNSGTAVFRAMGNSKVTMKTSLIMNAINVIGNAVLVYKFKMGVAGVAIPTLVSRVVAAIIIIYLLRNPSLSIHLSKPFKYKPNMAMVKDILHIGIPNGIESSMFQLGKILLLSVVATFGTTAITANAVGNTITAFQYLPGMAIGLALITVVSQVVGAGDYEQARYYTKLLLVYAHVVLIIVNVIIIIFINPILSVYNLSPETHALAKKVIIFYGINACISWPVAFTLPDALRAAKDVKFAMIISSASMWVIRIGLGVTFAKVLGFGMFGVWIGMICDWYVRGAFYIFRFKGTKWEEKTRRELAA